MPQTVRGREGRLGELLLLRARGTFIRVRSPVGLMLVVGEGAIIMDAQRQGRLTSQRLLWTGRATRSWPIAGRSGALLEPGGGHPLGYERRAEVLGRSIDDLIVPADGRREASSKRAEVLVEGQDPLRGRAHAQGRLARFRRQSVSAP